jgi:hypothetical protein
LVVAGSVGGEQFFAKLVLFYHKFEVDVDVLAALQVVVLLLLLLTLGLLHLQPSLLPVLLDLLDLLEVTALLLRNFHLNIICHPYYRATADCQSLPTADN